MENRMILGSYLIRQYRFVTYCCKFIYSLDCRLLCQYIKLNMKSYRINSTSSTVQNVLRLVFNVQKVKGTKIPHRRNISKIYQKNWRKMQNRYSGIPGIRPFRKPVSSENRTIRGKLNGSLTLVIKP